MNTIILRLVIGKTSWKLNKVNFKLILNFIQFSAPAKINFLKFDTY